MLTEFYCCNHRSVLAMVVCCCLCLSGTTLLVSDHGKANESVSHYSTIGRLQLSLKANKQSDDESQISRATLPLRKQSKTARSTAKRLKARGIPLRRKPEDLLQRLIGQLSLVDAASASAKASISKDSNPGSKSNTNGYLMSMSMQLRLKPRLIKRKFNDDDYVELTVQQRSYENII